MSARAAFAAITLLSIAFGVDCTGPTSESLVTPDQLSLIQSTCETVMHIRNGVDLQACLDSLSETAVALRENASIRRADADCVRKGVPRGTPEFAVCTLDVDKTHRSRAAMPLTLVYDPRLDSSEGYYDASFETKRRREKYSCAQLGIAQDSSMFGDCVADLDANLFKADHPYR